MTMWADLLQQRSTRRHDGKENRGNDIIELLHRSDNIPASDSQKKVVTNPGRKNKKITQNSVTKIIIHRCQLK